MSHLEFMATTGVKLLLAVPLIPLVGYVLQIFLRRRLPHGDKILTAGMFSVMCITVYLAVRTWRAAEAGEDVAFQSSLFGWLYNSSRDAADPLNASLGIYYDGLGAIMLAVVGIVSFCVHLFSTGYMHGDKRYPIFFANISLFTVAMLGLVLADSLLVLFIFWEIMGLMSYLLIGHFAHDPGSGFFHGWATWASKKAFLTTRVGDVLLFIGIFILYDQYGTFRFTELWDAVKHTVETEGGYPAWLTTAGLCIFGGTVGKSAQFPLHIWLPDAMAGPTPVSAMIHAATMVAAGVFLLGRTYPLLSPEVLTVVAVVGAFTALFAATIGLTAYDLKAVLAYSTISQLGFMVAAVGLGGMVAGMFHMVTHAFFKACLFLSAGSVIHGCHHEQDMRKMGGLRKMMPITFACMLICTIAIAGIPPFAGFYSKDKIIMAGFERVLEGDGPYGWYLFATVALCVAAALTAFYMFRLIFMTFFGEYRGAQSHDDHGHDDHGHDDHGHGHAHVPHESPLNMTIPLMLLTVFAIFGGHFWLSSDPLASHTKPWFKVLATPENMYGAEVAHWAVHHATEEIERHAHSLAMMVSLTVASLGIFLAWIFYMVRKDLPGKVAGGLGLVYVTVREKYYVDEVVEALVIKPSMGLAKMLKWVDEKVVDGLVLTVGYSTRSLGNLHAWFDRVFVDGLVNYVGLVSQAFGAVSRLLQTGRIQQYAAFAVGGGLLTAAWLILS